MQRAHPTITLPPTGHPKRERDVVMSNYSPNGHNFESYSNEPGVLLAYKDKENYGSDRVNQFAVDNSFGGNVRKSTSLQGNAKNPYHTTGNWSRTNVRMIQNQPKPAFKTI